MIGQVKNDYGGKKDELYQNLFYFRHADLFFFLPFNILSRRYSLPKISEQVTMLLIVTPRIPCMLRLWPVKNRFLILVRGDINDFNGLLTSFT